MVVEWGLWLGQVMKCFYIKTLPYAIPWSASLTFCHTQSNTSALLCAGGWSRQPPKPPPNKSSSDSDTRGSKKKSVYKPTTCQPNQLLATRHCDSKAEHKFSYSAFYPHRTSPRVISRGCRVYLPCFLQSEQTHHHTWIAAVSTQTDPTPGHAPESPSHTSQDLYHKILPTIYIYCREEKEHKKNSFTVTRVWNKYFSTEKKDKISSNKTLHKL